MPDVYISVRTVMFIGHKYHTQ